MIVLKFLNNGHSTHAWRETIFQAQRYVLNNSASTVNAVTLPC